MADFVKTGCHRLSPILFRIWFKFPWMLDYSEMRKQILILESVNEYYGKFDAVLIAFFLNI